MVDELRLQGDPIHKLLEQVQAARTPVARDHLTMPGRNRGVGELPQHPPLPLEELPPLGIEVLAKGHLLDRQGGAGVRVGGAVDGARGPLSDDGIELEATLQARLASAGATGG